MITAKRIAETLGLGAGLLAGVSTLALSANAQMVAPTTLPAPPKFPAQGDITYVEIDDIQEFRALSSYNEPGWMTEKFVKTGKLPAVRDRLPKEPLVFKTKDMPDGIGEYGGTLRHVIGGRPEGWNWISSQSQGWGGVSYTMWECMTRTGPLYHVKGSSLEPMPNLAKSWEWSKDGNELTMNLVEGAKWSDGDPFDSDDVMYYWNDHILDSNIAPQTGANQDTFGVGTTLEAMGTYQVKFTFKNSFPKSYLWEMAFGRFCPGPSHVMKPKHPKYGSGLTYDEYRNAFPPDMLDFPVMGSHVPVAYRADDIIVLRRNPYYWKVDEKGNQPPYLDEMHYKLST